MPHFSAINWQKEKSYYHIILNPRDDFISYKISYCALRDVIFYPIISWVNKGNICYQKLDFLQYTGSISRLSTVCEWRVRARRGMSRSRRNRKCLRLRRGRLSRFYCMSCTHFTTKMIKSKTFFIRPISKLNYDQVSRKDLPRYS